MVRSLDVSVLGGLVFLLLTPAMAVTVYAAPLGQVSKLINVDQFGYLPSMRKVAVLSDPQAGFNQAESYVPGPTLEVRRADNDRVVFRGSAAAWGVAATHAQSGDRVWWFDFSSLTRTGSYYVYDPTHQRRSHVFTIGNSVYGGVLKHALSTFFYQRCGYAKRAPYADQRWADDSCHLTDGRARSIQAQPNALNDATTERDLSGGWHDAGDYNKYTIITTEAISDLLLAYENNREVWTDDFNLPESGNGVPDILDEVQWELDWLLKMQNADGSVLTKLSQTDFNNAAPPSLDSTIRYYGAASTSATLAAAISFAHAAIVYRAFNATYSMRLQTAAIKAWQWAVANPNVLFDNTGFSTESTELDDYKRAMFRLSAAVYLFALTNDLSYRNHVEANLNATHMFMWDYWHCFESVIQDAMLYYAPLPNAVATTAQRIRNSKQSAINGNDFLVAFNNATDAYRGYLKDDLYTWGSNRLKARVGLLFLNQNVYGLDATNAANYRAAAAGYLHALHGVNPLGMAYLSNMYEAGAEACANEMFHRWFRDGSVWDNAQTSGRGPAPGYLTGGPNRAYSPSPQYTGTELYEIARQPHQKAYKDWNGDWPEDSWQITEPAIYYQAAYVNLLATTIKQFNTAK
jgi:hypothetical protein